MKKVKLIDVAQKAGVSKSTASQYLNGRYEYMSSATKEKIRLAIEELNFVPNPIARSLKTEKTNTIGIITNSIVGSITSQIIRGIDDFSKKKNYNVLIYNTDYKKELEQQSIASLKLLRADGLIITSSGEINDLLNYEDKNGLPVVHFNRSFKGLNVNTVLSDFSKGTYEAMDYLIKLGHKRIAVITRTYINIPSRLDRIASYKEALENHNLPYDASLIQVAEDTQSVASTYERLMSLDNPPTVIFTMFTKITRDLLCYFNEHHISIPEDISVISFDDLPLVELFKTPLTSVHQSAYQLGEETAKLLINKIKDPNTLQENVTLPCQLILRESCKKL